MLTSREKSGLREILNDLEDSVLFSLHKTLTKGILGGQPTSREDAVQAIMSCIEKPSDLLKRQRITKKILFSYLLKVKPVVSPELSKAELVVMCLQEWKSMEKCEINDYKTPSLSSETLDPSSRLLNEFGVEFCKWYFSQYNHLKEFGPEHFWADCKLLGELKIASDKKEAAVVGANEVANFLSSLVINDKYYFDANPSQNSITVEEESHGMRKITVSGVVHQSSNCIGLFDSVFGLVKDPALNDNWKIKWLQMKIHVTSSMKQICAPVNAYQSVCQKVYDLIH